MKLYYGSYGHHLSGKLYVYWGGDNFRTGQQVVAPVTNKQSGKTYNTMFTIVQSRSENNAQEEVSRLSSEGISIKTLGGTDVLTLPGGKEFKTKKEWADRSEALYRQRHGLQTLLPGKVERKKPETVKSTVGKTVKKSSNKPTITPTKTEKKKTRIKKLSASPIRDTATEKAKSALLARRKSSSDTANLKSRLEKMKGREAERE